MYNKKDALQKYADFRKSRFSEPAIVVSSDTSGSSRNLYPGYAVTFGTLETRAKAEDYAGRVAEITGYRSEITFNESDTTYRVSSQIFEDRGDAIALAQDLYRRSISSDSEFSVIRVGDEEIKGLRFDYSIEIVHLSNSTAREYYNVITNRNLLPAGARADVTDAAITIQDIQTWKQTVELKRNLERLLKEGIPVILLREYPVN